MLHHIKRPHLHLYTGYPNAGNNSPQESSHKNRVICQSKEAEYYVYLKIGLPRKAGGVQQQGGSLRVPLYKAVELQEVHSGDKG